MAVKGERKGNKGYIAGFFSVLPLPLLSVSLSFSSQGAVSVMPGSTDALFIFKLLSWIRPSDKGSSMLCVIYGLPVSFILFFNLPLVRVVCLSASLKPVTVFVDLPFGAFSFPTDLPMADGLHAEQDLFACGKQRSWCVVDTSKVCAAEHRNHKMCCSTGQQVCKVVSNVVWLELFSLSCGSQLQHEWQWTR